LLVVALDFFGGTQHLPKSLWAIPVHWALGGAIAGLAATLRVEMLLIPLGGLFVIITMSVLIQTVYFKISGGKRVFKMAPLHHHFELVGWEQITIVIRFWIIAGLSVAAGLGLFYAQWVAK
jgi:phospho-N-acetylmuramoyl-pentapeptide-transferase